MFSRRTSWDLTQNFLTQRKAALLEKGVRILDLTVSNPTQVGLRYPEGLLSVLGEPAALRYEPAPKGLRPAREAVASLYARKGVPVDPEAILLTASTSEAYGFLFQLLADPGDEVLVPTPSYPLFQYLAELNGQVPVSYPLDLDGRWRIDCSALENAVTERTRALVVVHPNNPTGSCVDRAEWKNLTRFCRAHQLPLISDEVFAEYRFPQEAGGQGPEGGIPETLLGEPELLTFALGGLSKWMGLPQMKLAWIAASGPAPALAHALDRLEVIADTALSVNGPVQHAFCGWVRVAATVQDQIRERILANRRSLQEALRTGPLELLPADGGWSAVLHRPDVTDGEAWVLDLMERKQVWVHPGSLFDFKKEGIVVVSLLTQREIFEEGIRRLNGLP